MKETNWKGIKSNQALCFPEKGGRKFGNKIWESGFRWTISDLMEFLFPPQKMPKHHEIAVEYIKFLLENGDSTDNRKNLFCQKTGYSSNTLKQHIIPKLYRFGLIHRNREYPKNVKWTIKSKRRSHEKESLAFSTMLRKMASEWEEMVTTARAKRQIQENKAEDKMKEIQRQEKLEWEKWEKERALGY